MSNQKFSMSGRVVHLTPIETRGSWTSRTVAIETDGQYPQSPAFEFGGKDQRNADKLEGVHVGDSVTIEFEIRGRRWDGKEKGIKYFTTLAGWKIEVQSKGARSAPSSSSEFGPGDPNDPDNTLPF